MQPAMLTRVGGRPTRAACIFLRDTAYLIGAQARTPAGYQKYRAEIEAAIASFHALTDKERAFARPLRLRVINRLYPAGEPVAGQPLKIVE